MVSANFSNPAVVARSKASTVLLDSVDPGAPLQSTQLAVVPAPSNASPNPEMGFTQIQTSPKLAAEQFKPFQLLMETEITLEYGKQLKSTRVIHEELLCCHSQHQLDLFQRAKSMREAYDRANRMRKGMKTYVDMTAVDLEEQQLEGKTIVSLVRVYEHYPGDKRSQVRKVVDACIEDQVGKRNFSDKALQKKDLKNMDISSRLQKLNAKGLIYIAQSLAGELRSIKAREIQAAKTNQLKAAAQRRIILLNVDERSIKSLVAWLYGQGTLTYESAEHLYELHALAERLGIVQLAEQCLTKLASGVEETIQFALCQGLTLSQLFGFGSGPGEHDDQETHNMVAAGNVAEIVVHRVLKDDRAPARLRTLVVGILAEHLDSELWEQLCHTTTHSMALSIIEFTLRRGQTKQEVIEAKLERDP